MTTTRATTFNRETTPSYLQVETAVQALGLQIYGALHPAQQPVQGLSDGVLVLVGTGPGFWPHFTLSSEYLDQLPDSVDRWSSRSLGALAKELGAEAYFPFGGPPYTPFINWAQASGRAFTSPSQMMVHDEVGMLISYRGALHFDQSFDIPPPSLAHSPCVTCAAKPCLNTCPAQALIDGGPYDLTACHHHLDTPAGTPCMTQGCLARRACPLSQGAGRSFEQTAHHMRYFHRS
ncbi:ferredoxin [Pseudophaeobacter sp.]|uniref:ferredoxin n=1 Tax=Pseudophaeobacter sp. TaxID=1971739 RepID=UPI004058626B